MNGDGLSPFDFDEGFGLGDNLFDDMMLQDLLATDTDLPDIPQLTELELSVLQNTVPNRGFEAPAPAVPPPVFSSGTYSSLPPISRSYYSTLPLSGIAPAPSPSLSSGTGTSGGMPQSLASILHRKEGEDMSDEEEGVDEESTQGGPGGPKRIVRDKARRQKHNATERRRLQKINDRINDLKVLMNSHGVKTKENKTEVLQTAVEHMHMLNTNLIAANIEKADREAEVSALRALISTLAGRGAMPVAPTDPSSSTVGSSKAVNYRRTFQLGMIPAVVCALNGVILDCSLMFTLLVGYNREELATLTMANLFGSVGLNGTNSASVFSQIVAKHLEDTRKAVLEMQREIICKGDHPCHVVLRSILLCDESNVPTQLHMILLPQIHIGPVGTTRSMCHNTVGSGFKESLLDRSSVNEFIMNPSGWFTKRES